MGVEPGPLRSAEVATDREETTRVGGEHSRLADLAERAGAKNERDVRVELPRASRPHRHRLYPIRREVETLSIHHSNLDLTIERRRAQSIVRLVHHHL